MFKGKALTSKTESKKATHTTSCGAQSLGNYHVVITERLPRTRRLEMAAFENCTCHEFVARSVVSQCARIHC